ncbi:MAG TPA: hypothetical protein PLD17_09530 [Flavobacteriales bacterium]|nr:hypothetical protein [Flavobacteriales bacterium]
MKAIDLITSYLLLAAIFAAMEEGKLGHGNKKAPLLKQLLTVSFMNIGAFVVFYSIGMIGMLGIKQLTFDEFVGTIEPQIELMGGYDALPGIEQLTHLIYDHGAMLMALLLLRTVVRGIGAYLIYKGRKNGFMVYAIAQLVGIFLPHIVLPWVYLGFFGPLSSVSMTALYGSILRPKKVD